MDRDGFKSRSRALASGAHAGFETGCEGSDGLRKGSRPDTGLTWRRTIRFYSVGAVGVGVQLGALWALASLLGWHYLAATVAATEAAVLHNFVWHIRWTWADRPGSAAETLRRLVRFHVTNGLVSIVGNVLLMMLLTGFFKIHYLLANAASILACALANLALSEFWVFRSEWKPCEHVNVPVGDEGGLPRRC